MRNTRSARHRGLLKLKIRVKARKLLRTAPNNHRRDMHPELVRKPRIEDLLNHIATPDHVHKFVASRLLSLPNRTLNPISHKRKRRITLRNLSRRSRGHHENRYPPIQVVSPIPPIRHIVSPPTADHRANLVFLSLKKYLSITSPPPKYPHATVLPHRVLTGHIGP